LYAEIAKLKISEFTKQKEATKLALLRSPNEAEQTETDTREFTIKIQRELNRLGCNAGVPDGLWGHKSQVALRNFLLNSNRKITSLEPSPQVLNYLTSREDHICSEQKENSDRNTGVDGAWTLRLKANSGCGWANKTSANVRIVNGRINSSNRLEKWQGSVTENGRIAITMKYQTNGRHKTRKFRGSIDSGSGRGTFRNSGFPCHGKFTMSRG